MGGGYRTQMADELKALGAFRGTDIGYELDGQANRAQAAAMLVRLLGKEAEALGQTYVTPFTDVPDWAMPYVGYLYTQGITNGISATEFGASRQTTYQQYLTFVLRALGYDSNTDFKWDESQNKAAEINMVSSYDIQKLRSKSFLRDDMVYLSYQGLKAFSKGTSARLVDKLLADGSLKAANNTQSILGNRSANSGNSVNYGGAVQFGEYVYYVEGINGSIYKISEKNLFNNDFADKQLIAAGKYRELSLASGYLYFAGADGGYFRCGLGGGEVTKITSDTAAYANVVRGVVYYKNYSDSGKLYRINVDGSGRAKLTDVEVGAVNAFEDYVFFMNKDDDFKSYRVSVDGGPAIKVGDGQAWRLNVVDGVIFCGDLDKNLFRMNADGAGRIKLYTSAKDVDLVLFHDGYIYFTSGGDELSRLNVETKAVESLMTFSSWPQSLAYINNAVVVATTDVTYFLLG
jgi:hypothetical protein